MVAIRVPGSDIWLDPDEITKLDIVVQKEGGILMEVFLKAKESPIQIKFKNKPGAIEFYNKIWQSRESENE